MDRSRHRIARRISRAALVPAFLLAACAHDYTRWEGTVAARTESVRGPAGTSDLTRSALSATTRSETRELIERNGAFAYYSALMIEATPDGATAEPAPERRATSTAESDPSETETKPDGAATAPPIRHRRTSRLNRAKLDFMYGDEFRRIREAKGAERHTEYVGLALSGGGIRSATFCTGVVRGLHDLGVLHEVGFLSTVSGGGYAGSWYMLHDDPDELLRPGSEHLQHLTQHGHYLTDGHASKSTVELISNFGAHVCFWPFAAFVNEVPFHYQRNPWGVREDYRQGIQQAFHYDRPLLRTHSNWGTCRDENLLRTSEESIAGVGPSRDKPFWIVNAHVSLKDDPSPLVKNRSGDAFELTPLRAGSRATDYVHVECDAEGSRWWMTPAYGVAISGAAVDSTSLKQGWLASKLLYLLNFDLGYFVDAWGVGWVEGDDCASWNQTAYFLKGVLPVSLLRWIVPPWFEDHRLTTEGKRLALTDGGHFENLGLYALVKRGCRVIIVADGSHDEHVNDWHDGPNVDRASAFDDLRHFETLLHTDFGAILRMNWDTFDPRASGGTFTDRAPAIVMTGTIPNLPIDPSPGHGKEGAVLETVHVIYLKAAYDLDGALRRSATFIDREAAESGDFPHRPTSDQYLEEQQMAAYQRLGYEAVVGNAAKFRNAFRALAHDMRN